MTLGASAVRGNHDDRALSAYRKLKRFGPEVLLMLSGNPLCRILVLLPIHTAVCLACLHARVLLCDVAAIFAGSDLRCVKGIQECG